MQEVRRAGERGSADHGWLRSFHSFLFADYYDPEHVEFGPLRVINEDRVTPGAGAGFGTHSHRDMEMISYCVHCASDLNLDLSAIQSHGTQQQRQRGGIV